MRKYIFLFAVLALTAGTVSAQTHWTSAELSVLGAGVRYEYVVNRYISVGANFYYNNYLINYLDLSILSIGGMDSILGLNAVGRWYPFGRRFFMELGLGYSGFWVIREVKESQTERYWDSYYQSYRYRDSFTTVEETFFTPGFILAPGFGWVIDVGGPGGFFISPGVQVPLVFDGDLVAVGFNFYFGIGISR